MCCIDTVLTPSRHCDGATCMTYQLSSFVAHSRAYMAPSQHIYGPWWLTAEILLFATNFFFWSQSGSAALLPQNFAAAHPCTFCWMHDCCDTYQYLLNFGGNEPNRLNFRWFFAAIHGSFGGDTYKFWGSNAALWPRKHPLQTMRFELAIETSIPATILCRHNHDAWQQALCVMNPVNALFWLRIHRILRPLGDSCISV